MNKFFEKIKNILYALPFGLKGADTEIMGSGESDGSNGTVITQQVNDKRVAKHLLKGEITQEVEELRYRTYKVARESDKYQYVSSGIANKKENKSVDDVIKFSQKNKLVCEDVLTELKRVDNYGTENYTVHIDYIFPVRIKLEQFITLVDVYIKKGENSVTTFHFDDIMNPSNFKSKPFINELLKLNEAFNNNDTYGISKSDYAASLLGMNFTTSNVTGDEPDIINYSFLNPSLISVNHNNGEFTLTYQWGSYTRTDLTEKFFNAELEEKYQKKAKRDIPTDDMTIEDIVPFNAENAPNYFAKCSKCGRDISKYIEGFVTDKVTGEPICIDCYKNSLLNLTK